MDPSFGNVFGSTPWDKNARLRFFRSSSFGQEGLRMALQGALAARLAFQPRDA